jgi:hypothetical protein
MICPACDQRMQRETIVKIRRRRAIGTSRADVQPGWHCWTCKTSRLEPPVRSHGRFGRHACRPQPGAGQTDERPTPGRLTTGAPPVTPHPVHRHAATAHAALAAIIKHMATLPRHLGGSGAPLAGA